MNANIQKVMRYGVAGSATALVNFGAVWFFIEVAGLSTTALERNIAHFLGIAVSLLFSFHVHTYWTWKGNTGRYVTKFVQFQLISGFTVLLRQAMFLVLDRYGFNWAIATVVPIGVAVVINFLGYDRVVFQKASALMHEEAASGRKKSG